VLIHHFGIFLITGGLLGLFSVETCQVILLLFDSRHAVEEPASLEHAAFA
jgi:hypothetical protein